jgi:hypothetical protein
VSTVKEKNMSLLFEMLFSLILDRNFAMIVNIDRIVTIRYYRQKIINYSKSGLDLVTCDHPNRRLSVELKCLSQNNEKLLC